MQTISFANKINLLPSELLAQILFLSQKQTLKDRYPHLRLLSVCRYWRRIINGYGGFWTMIHFSPWKGEGFIRELVARSRSAKLSVFSPHDHDILIQGRSRLERNRVREIIVTFSNLLQTEGHRIKFLFLTEDRLRKLPKAAVGKALPILKTFIFEEADSEFRLDDASEPFAIIKSAQGLENLNITSVGSSSLSKLKLTFNHLKNLKIRFTSDAPKEKFFLSFLPLCYKLESLIVLNSQHGRYLIPLPSAITLPDLISLDVDCCTLVHTLRAPVLKRLIVSKAGRPGFDQHDYLIFEEFDLSSVTQFSAHVMNILQPQRTMVALHGGPTQAPVSPYTLDLWAPYESAKNWNQAVDLREDIALTPDFAQFYIWVPANHVLPFDSTATELRDSGHSYIWKILPKLHNLEMLSIVLSSSNRVAPLSASYLESTRMYVKEILDSIISIKLGSFAVREVDMDVNILLLIFDFINCHPSLSNVDKFIFVTYLSDHHYIDEELDAFGRELVNSLRLRRKAGHKALPNIELHWGRPLPWKWVSEAATLGTRVLEFPYLPISGPRSGTPLNK